MRNAEMTGNYYADLHIHVGANEDGRWVKIPAAKGLTVRNILREASTRKGLDVIGIADSLSPLVQKDLCRLAASGELAELPGGGYSWRGRLTVILGGEVETREKGGGLAHSLLFLPTLAQMRELSDELSLHIKNINMSSQNAHMDLRSLYALARGHGAKIIPAHIFTPFKSVYGNCARRMAMLFDGEAPGISAVELGLSADSYMADRIEELREITYLANSDAHSPQNIGREFTALNISGAVNFANIFAAIEGKKGKVAMLYGLHPALGKYYLTRCAACGAEADYQREKCPLCGGRVVRGVKQRVDEIADCPEGTFPRRQPGYRYHFPLSELPGVGAKALQKVYCGKLTDIELMYKSDARQVKELLGERILAIIEKAVGQKLRIFGGGAGRYGYVIIEKKKSEALRQPSQTATFAMAPFNGQEDGF
ncbi:MAG: endonuclease Q family protein [Acidaminococcales bacterium]|jgi:uncharacterized protein (TIGR00375 family)|nr:endonuclease Q family protein [Acidaminococcales bacterium]